MTNEEKKVSKSIRELLDVGSEITGGTSGAAIGLLAGGPVGAILGAASGPIITKGFKKIAVEIAHRLLGHREKARVGATISFSAEKIEMNLKNGFKIRHDDFFKNDKNSKRSSFDEIMEGVLLTAQREYQEKKLIYYGNLLANIAFHPEIDKGQANLLIKLGEELSYRQLCLLSLFINLNKSILRDTDYRNEKQIDQSLVAILHEIYDLYLRGLLNCSGITLLGIADIVPSKMNVQGMGANLYKLMELNNFDAIDANEILIKIIK